MLRPLIPIVNYIVNYDYIVDELCVNRDKPELNCNGRCYLMQALADEASKKKESEERGAKNNLNSNIAFFHAPGQLLELSLLKLESKNVACDMYVSTHTIQFIQKLIKPPIV